MNRDAVEERLLDLALEEVLADATAAAVRPARLVSPAAAVCMLAGIAVVVALAWSMRVPTAPFVARAASPQDASSPPARATGAAELARLPANTRDLEVSLSDPAELATLTRFRDLRRLRLDYATSRAGIAPDAAAWRRQREERTTLQQRFCGADAFLALRTLRTLEFLQLPPGQPSAPEQLAFLRDLQVRSLGVIEVDLRSAAMHDALLAAPSCRELLLTGVLVDAALVAALPPLRLERLDLLACSGLDDATWAAIAELDTLRHLEVTCQHGGQLSSQGTSHPLDTLGEAAFEALVALPALRHLGLDESAFPDDLLTRLPATLQSLDLGDRPMQEGAARMLRRLSGLRRLTFGCGLDAASAAAVLPSWSLEQLDYRGKVLGRQLLEAIAAQPRLQELALHVSPRVDLTPLATAPQLRMLEVRAADPWHPDAPGISLTQLAPLVDCKELRVLRLRDGKLDLADVRARFGERVVVEAVTR